MQPCQANNIVRRSMTDLDRREAEPLPVADLGPLLLLVEGDVLVLGGVEDEQAGHQTHPGKDAAQHVEHGRHLVQDGGTGKVFVAVALKLVILFTRVVNIRLNLDFFLLYLGVWEDPPSLKGNIFFHGANFL